MQGEGLSSLSDLDDLTSTFSEVSFPKFCFLALMWSCTGRFLLYQTIVGSFDQCFNNRPEGGWDGWFGWSWFNHLVLTRLNFDVKVKKKKIKKYIRLISGSQLVQPLTSLDFSLLGMAIFLPILWFLSY